MGMNNVHNKSLSIDDKINFYGNVDAVLYVHPMSLEFQITREHVVKLCKSFGIRLKESEKNE